MTQTVSIAQDTRYPYEGIQILTEGDQVTFVCIKEGVTTITNDATLGMKVYKGSTDVTSSVTTGSMSATGNRVTLKTLVNLIAGTTQYHVTVQGTCDGVYMTFGAFWIMVRKLSGK